MNTINVLWNEKDQYWQLLIFKYVVKRFQTFNGIDKAKEVIHISSSSSPSVVVLLHTKVWFISIVCAANTVFSIHIKWYKVWHLEGSTNLMSLTVAWSVSLKKILDINTSFKNQIFIDWLNNRHFFVIFHQLNSPLTLN